MTLGRGLAILGIWLAVAVLGWRDPMSGIVVGLFAVIATGLVVSADSD